MLSAMLMLAMSITSCSKDDDDKGNKPSKNIIGAWKQVGSNPLEMNLYIFSKDKTGKMVYILYDTEGNITNYKITNTTWDFVDELLSVYCIELDNTRNYTLTITDKDHINLTDEYDSGNYIRIQDSEANDLIESTKDENRILGVWLETTKRDVKMGSSTYKHQALLVLKKMNGYYSLRIATLMSTPGSPDYIFDWTNDYGNWSFTDYDKFKYSINNGANSGEVNFDLYAKYLKLYGDMPSCFGTKEYNRVESWYADTYYEK